MSNHSVIEHRANYHYVKIEEDYIAICLGGRANPHCKALILSILENWTNTKRDKGEDLGIYMTYPQWIRATYWLFGRNVIIEALEELFAEELIGRREYRTHGKDTFIYTLNVKAVQEKIRQLPEKAQDDYLPSFNLNAFKNKRVPNQTRPKSNGKKQERVYYQTSDAFNKGRNIDYITEIESNIDSFASPSVDAEPSDFSFQEIPVTYAEALAYLVPHDPHEGLDAVQVVKLAQKLWVEAHEDDDPEKTHGRIKAVKPETPLEHTPSASPTAAPDSPLAPPSKPEPAALGNENGTHFSTPDVDNSQRDGDKSPQQQMLVAPVASKQSARQEKKAIEPKTEPTPEEIVLQERCKAWYDRLTEWCGGPMTKGGQVINEHKSIKLACQKYSDVQLDGIFTYLTTRDWKYSKIDNKYTVRGYVLWDEAGRVAQILREERQSKKSGINPSPASGKVTPLFARNLTEEMAAMRAQYAKASAGGD